ncbi:hypothetical protein FB45DRAFT_1033960 [Roridomyces roridus]|uniref:Uncharacterized protein n=1 Tax=Roridomyces roridus TaxID=1738132 RepID=A0AAD7FHG1_9AGAR|nr:hypothetical protein FB45DRAFT_1033960 [Roridomyces roridus]
MFSRAFRKMCTRCFGRILLQLDLQNFQHLPVAKVWRSELYQQHSPKYCFFLKTAGFDILGAAEFDLILLATAGLTALVFAATLLHRRSQKKKKQVISQIWDTPLPSPRPTFASELSPAPFMLDQAEQQGVHLTGQKIQLMPRELSSYSITQSPGSAMDGTMEEHAVMSERGDIHPGSTTSPPSYLA